MSYAELEPPAPKTRSLTTTTSSSAASLLSSAASSSSRPIPQWERTQIQSWVEDCYFIKYDVRSYRNLAYIELEGVKNMVPAICKECQLHLDVKHYSKFNKCPRCNYGTFCMNAWHHHTKTSHPSIKSSNSKLGVLNPYKSRVGTQPPENTQVRRLTCSYCQFITTQGDAMGRSKFHHLRLNSLTLCL